MKPSEAMQKVMSVGDLAESLFRRAGGVRSAFLAMLEDIDKDPLLLSECGERAVLILEDEDEGPEETAPFAGLIPPKSGDEAPYGRLLGGAPKKKPGRKAKAADGARTEEPPAAADPKPHVAPLASPLTPELCAALEHALGASPTTVYALSKLSTLHGLDIEGLLREAPDRFIRWTDPGPQRYELWGLLRQFDHAVGMLTLQCSKADRAKYTSEALGCSVAAALAAWGRLDPEAT
jgi:hypothetical protein